MKKLFTLFFSLLLASLFTTASAQQNIFVWKKGGDLSVISSESVDSVSFSTGSWLFHITTSAAVSVTTNSFQARSSVSLNENVKSLSVIPEVGVCYSDKNPQPTYVDGKQSSDANMEDNIFIVEGLVSGTLYYYRTYVKLLDEVYYDQNVYTVTTRGAKPQGKIIGGHKFIDLGLPSGLLWAETNVGASSYFDDGDYFAWGETETKSSYSWDTYKWKSSGNSLSKYNSEDGKTTLDAEDDVATVQWGEGCRMPPRAEFQELYDKCDWSWKSDYKGTGVSGRLVTGPNNNTIFLPASGYRYKEEPINARGLHGSYWSSSLYSSDDVYVYNLCFYSPRFDNGSISPSFYNFCFFGFPVRPVAEK